MKMLISGNAQLTDYQKTPAFPESFFSHLITKK